MIVGGDPIGDAVIRLGFQNSDYFNILGKTFKLLNESDPKATKYLGILSTFLSTGVGSTKASQALGEAYTRLDSKLKKDYPGII